MMKVFVTGSKGYIGSALLKMLEINNYEVCSYDLIEGQDICNLDQLIDSMTKFKPDVVIHLAAMSNVKDCNENPQKANFVNREGTKNVLTAMSKCNCNKIIYASTSSVYGNQEPPFFEDKTPVNPCSVYGSSKLLGEEYIINSNNNFLNFRMFNVVGTIGDPNIDMIPKPGNDRLFSALEKGEITIYGNDYQTKDGTCERDYISLKDTINAYILGIKLLMKNDVKEIINIGTGIPSSVLGLVKQWPNMKSIIYGDRRIGDPSCVYSDITKAKLILNWTPIKSVTDIINEIIIDKKINLN